MGHHYLSHANALSVKPFFLRNWQLYHHVNKTGCKVTTWILCKQTKYLHGEYGILSDSASWLESTLDSLSLKNITSYTAERVYNNIRTQPHNPLLCSWFYNRRQTLPDTGLFSQQATWTGFKEILTGSIEARGDGVQKRVLGRQQPFHHRHGAAAGPVGRSSDAGGNVGGPSLAGRSQVRRSQRWVHGVPRVHGEMERGRGGF